jgi:hypothetical protein
MLSGGPSTTIGERLDKTSQAERPGKVIVAILTDGLENASQEFKPKQIRSMIEHQREKYSWEFIYLGANQDAIEVGETMGIAAGCAVTFNETPEGASEAFAAVNHTIGAYRASAPNYTEHLKKATKKTKSIQRLASCHAVNLPRREWRLQRWSPCFWRAPLSTRRRS